MSHRWSETQIVVDAVAAVVMLKLVVNEIIGSDIRLNSASDSQSHQSTRQNETFCIKVRWLIRSQRVDIGFNSNIDIIIISSLSHRTQRRENAKYPNQYFHGHKNTH